MEKKIIIHIGLHKTGTTFLQSNIFPKINNINLITRPFTQFNKTFNKLQYSDDSIFKIDELQNLLAKFQDKTILISDENLSGKLFLFNHINRTIIANRLAKIAPDATIILFIRNQYDMINSIYNHYIKGIYKGTKAIHKFIRYNSLIYEDNLVDKANSEIRNYDDFLYYNTDDINIHLDTLLYYELIKLYKSLFKNVEVFLYEDLLSNPYSVINRFKEIIGSDLKINGEIFNQKENISLNRIELRAQRKMNQLNLSNKRIKKIFNAYYKLKDRKEDFKLDFDLIKEYYTENNKKLNQYLPEINMQKYKDSYYL